jgi:hypothetical protein
MTDRIKIEFEPIQLLDVDRSVQDPSLIPQWTSEEATEGVDDAAPSAGPDFGGRLLGGVAGVGGVEVARGLVLVGWVMSVSSEEESD